MKKEKTNKNLYLFAIICSIIGITLAYAAFSQTLIINGRGTVKASNWSVHFADMKPAISSGLAKVISTPSINDRNTHIIDYEVEFYQLNDALSFEFDVVNDGAFDAEITTLNIPTPICTGSGENAVIDAKKICDNLTYELTYKDGTPLALNDSLNSGESKKLKLNLSYKNDALTEIKIDEDVNISNLSISVIYSQK